MTEQQRSPYPRASTFKLLPNSEWEPFQKIIDAQTQKKSLKQRFREILSCLFREGP